MPDPLPALVHRRRQPARGFLPSRGRRSVPILTRWVALTIATMGADAVAAAPSATASPPPPAADCIDPAKPGPVFRFIRHEERYCRRAGTPDDPWWYPLKTLGDDDGPQAAVGGELRARWERYEPARAGLRGGRDDGYLLYRGLLHGELRVGETARAFAQLGYWSSRGRIPAAAPTDLDRGDVQQLFVDWRPAPGTQIRLGRQELQYGSGRLVGVRHAPNIRFTFDGVRAATPAFGGTLEAFHLRPVAIDPESWDNRENTAERIAGLHYTRAAAVAGFALDAYAFRFERAAQRYQNAQGRQHRAVFGARVHGTRGPWTLDHELMLQDGRIGDQTVRAFSLQTDTRWRITPEAPWSVGARIGYASGDDDADDDRLGTFEPIYTTPPYYMQSALLSPSNLVTVQPYLEWRFSPRLTLTAEAQGIWRAETADGFYQPPTALQVLDGDGRRLGHQAGLALRFAARRDLLLEAWASRLQVDGALQRAGAEDTTFLAAMATWSF